MPRNGSYSSRVCPQFSFFFFFPEISTSHRSEKSELSIGEDIEEDLSVGLDDANTSDKVRVCMSHGAPSVPVRCLGYCKASEIDTD